MKTFIEFRSTYEDDAQFDPDGNCLVPGGRGIMDAYVSWVRGRCERIDVVDQHSFYGWSVQLKINDGWVWQLIQNHDPWLLIAEARSIRIPFVNAKVVDARLEESLSLFKGFLGHDDHLEFVAEHTRAEYQASSGRQSNEE